MTLVTAAVHCTVYIVRYTVYGVHYIVITGSIVCTRTLFAIYYCSYYCMKNNMYYRAASRYREEIYDVYSSVGVFSCSVVGLFICLVSCEVGGSYIGLVNW